MTTFSISERRACELLGVWRSSCRYQLKPDRDGQLREQLTSWLGSDCASGTVDWVCCWLATDNPSIHKRLYRVYRQAGLSVKRIRSKKLVRVGVKLGTAVRPRVHL